MERISVCTEEIEQTAQQLRAGDTVYLSGTIYTARDAAHKRLNEMLDRGEQLPFPLVNAVVYYYKPGSDILESPE